MAPEAEDRKENGGAADVLTRDFILLFIASFFLIGSLYLLIPVLPLYLVDVADATTTQVGLLIGVLTFASFLLRPYVGRKSDEIGRKPFLVVGAAIFVVATLLYIPARSLWTLPFVLAFNGMGIACFHTASLTFIGDIAPILQRGRSQAWFQSSFNIAVMTCPPLGVLLKDSLGYKWVFIAASLAAAVALLISVFITERMKRPEQGRGANLRGVDMRKLIVLVSVAVFASTASLGTIEAFLGLFAEAEKISHFALFFTISGAVLIVLRLAGGTLVDTLGRRLTGFLALLSLGSSMLILAAANGFFLLCVSAVAWGAGFAFASPAFSAMLMDRVPHEELGRAFGIYTTAFEGGIVFGAMVMGPVVSSLGFRIAFVIIGGVCLAGAAFFVSAYEALAPKTTS